MNEYLTIGFENLISDEESYWDDPYKEYIEEAESKGYSEMYFDFNDEDRPVWLF